MTHRAFTWDAPEGEEGAVIAEFGDRGYEIERSVGLITAPEEITPPDPAGGADGDRAKDGGGRGGESEIRSLDPRDGCDEPLWEGALGVQLANEAADPEAGTAFAPFRPGPPAGSAGRVLRWPGRLRCAERVSGVARWI